MVQGAAGRSQSSDPAAGVIGTGWKEASPASAQSKVGIVVH
jgi:hypothetical protein